MNESDARSLANLFAALCDPTRLRLLSLMSEKAVSVGFLADSTGDSQPKVSRHLAYLRGADLVSTERDGKHVYYQLRRPTDGRQSQVISAILGEEPSSSAARPTKSADVYANTYTTTSEPAEMEIYLL